MEKSYLQILANGTEVIIKFKDESESTTIYSKKELLRAINDVFQSKKINQEEYELILKKASTLDNLPWTVTEDTLIDKTKKVPIVVVKAFFNAQDNRIYCKEGATIVLYSKELVINAVSELFMRGYINNQEFDNLQLQIDSLLFP